MESKTPKEILLKYEDNNEYHFHNVDRKWIIQAMEEYGKQQYNKGVLDCIENATAIVEYDYINENYEAVISGISMKKLLKQ